MSVATATMLRGTPTRPGLILIALFSLTALALANIGPTVEGAPRWPAESALYAIEGWTVSPPTVDDSRPGAAMVSHAYAASDGTRATVVVSTSQVAKLVYRAGADVPFLGNGYTVEQLPASGGRTAFVARRGDEAWLQISVYGEQRGQLGNGAVAWTLSTVDSIFGRGNDYYLARIVVPYTEANASRATSLADALFPRLATFYAR